MATPDKKKTAEEKEGIKMRELVPGVSIPNSLFYEDKAPQATAHILASHAQSTKDVSLEKLFYVWAGTVGVVPDLTCKRILQAIDQLLSEA